MITHFEDNVLRSDVQPAVQFHALMRTEESIRHKCTLHRLYVVLLGYQAAFGTFLFLQVLGLLFYLPAHRRLRRGRVIS